jgi:protein-disulfide isomerase
MARETPAAALWHGAWRLTGAAAMAVMVGLSACTNAGAPPATLAQAVASSNVPPLEQLRAPGPLGDRTMGQPSAPVTVIEYASLTCPFCRQFREKVFPQFKREFIDTGKVYYIFREYPIGRQAAAAAIAARCAPEDKFFALNERLLASQARWTAQEVRLDPIYKIVQEFGISRAEFDTCQQNQTIVEGLLVVKQKGREYGVSGTPTLFVNQSQIRGVVTFEQISGLIQAELDRAKPSPS